VFEIMTDKKTDKRKTAGATKRDGVTEVTNILEELAGALVMALLIIGFVVQPFIIPTGSMAETLKGAHFRFCCPQCGYRYDRDFLSRSSSVPPGRMFPPPSRCPSCGYYYDPRQPVLVAKGDKILALKFLYQFVEPKRWDVIVFKNPTNPEENYIKRLIGKPGEKVEIIDGDIYINDRIATKPPKVQQEMWMLVYDGDYVPVKPNVPLFNGHKWREPMENYGDSNWRQEQDGLCRFVLDDSSGRENRLVYDTSAGNNFRATYAYDDVAEYDYLPRCSDLMVRFSVRFQGDGAGRLIGAGLRKYQRYYKGLIDENGRMTIARADGGSERILAEGTTELPANGKLVPVTFSNVDHILKLTFGDDEISYNMGASPNDAGPYRLEAEPEVEIIGSGKLEVSHIAVYRDTYYLSEAKWHGLEHGHATQGNPLTLGKDEYFFLGDNSPESSDGRWWRDRGIGNNGKTYRAGIVPREYLVGKAFVVFWPSGYRPLEQFPFRIVPNMREIRLIYGGSNKNP
jgi:signal peptidase I